MIDTDCYRLLEYSESLEMYEMPHFLTAPNQPTFIFQDAPQYLREKIQKQ